MNLESTLIFLSDTLEAMGGILVAYMVINVHHRVWREHKIDAVVFEEMRKERVLGLVGIALIAIGYFANIFVQFFL
jgi:hypothetical protein